MSNNNWEQFRDVSFGPIDLMEAFRSEYPNLEEWQYDKAFTYLNAVNYKQDIRSRQVAATVIVTAATYVDVELL